MFDISRVTFDRLSSCSEQSFLSELMAFLLDEVEELRDIPQYEMAAQLQVVVSQARGYGFESEEGIATYALAVAYLGLDFDQHFDGARFILESQDNEQFKIERLEAFAVNLFEALED